MEIFIKHPIELIYNQSEPSRKERLIHTVNMAVLRLCNLEILNILSVEDHKGALTVRIYEEDGNGNTFRAFVHAWDFYNEYDVSVSVVGHKLPF